MSSAIIARLLVRSGTPYQLKGGDRFSPWQVFSSGMRFLGLISVKLALVSWKSDVVRDAADWAPSPSELEQPQAMSVNSRTMIAASVRDMGTFLALIIQATRTNIQNYAA